LVPDSRVKQSDLLLLTLLSVGMRHLSVGVCVCHHKVPGHYHFSTKSPHLLLISPYIYILIDADSYTQEVTQFTYKRDREKRQTETEKGSLKQILSDLMYGIFLTLH